jgi:hypothetical protein
VINGSLFSVHSVGLRVNSSGSGLRDIIIDLESAVSLSNEWVLDGVVEALVDWWDWLEGGWSLLNLLEALLLLNWLDLDVLWWWNLSNDLLVDDLLGLLGLVELLKSLGVTVHLPVVVETGKEEESHNWADSAAVLLLVLSVEAVLSLGFVILSLVIEVGGGFLLIIGLGIALEDSGWELLRKEQEEALLRNLPSYGSPLPYRSLPPLANARLRQGS